MLLIIDGQIHDLLEKPLFIAFKNDDERKAVIENLISMPEKEGSRLYGAFPVGFEPHSAETLLDKTYECVKKHYSNW